MKLSWDELTPEVKKAADVLGLYEKVWPVYQKDGSGMACEDLDWDELDEEQQEAAETLGYDEDAWDADDE